MDQFANGTRVCHCHPACSGKFFRKRRFQDPGIAKKKGGGPPHAKIFVGFQLVNRVPQKVMIYPQKRDNYFSKLFIYSPKVIILFQLVHEQCFTTQIKHSKIWSFTYFVANCRESHSCTFCRQIHQPARIEGG